MAGGRFAKSLAPIVDQIDIARMVAFSAENFSAEKSSIGRVKETIALQFSW